MPSLTIRGCLLELLSLLIFFTLGEELEGDEGEGGSILLLPQVSAAFTNHSKVPLRSPCDNVTRICSGEFTDCRKGICLCQLGYAPRPDNHDSCSEIIYYNLELQTDPTMIGVVIGLGFMSVTLCVVMRLFAKARFRENRTIFNTPNPRLMNVSLMKTSKHLFRGRRGSETSENSVGPPPCTQTPTPAPHSTGNRPVNPNRVLRSQMSTDTTMSNTVGTPSSGAITAGTSSTAARYQKGKSFRQDSVTSNSNV